MNVIIIPIIMSELRLEIVLSAREPGEKKKRKRKNEAEKCEGNKVK